MSNVLVTGGAGYVGSHACKRLAELGMTPITYDHLGSGHEWAVKWGPLERGELEDKARLIEVMMRYAPSAVLHFAGAAYVGESVSNPWRYFRNNVGGTLSLLEVMRESRIDKLVFSSTCSTFGVPTTELVGEEHTQSPVNPYGRSKLIVEQMLRDVASASDLRYVSLRYFNAAGADAQNEIGELHYPETHLIPLVLQVAHGQRPHIDVFGTDYPTHDGTAVRDYVHVTDLADAHFLALDYLDAGGASIGLNLGTGRGYSVLEVIRSAETITGKKVAWRPAARRSGDPPALIANPSRAKEIMRWSPSHSTLENILRTAWGWHRSASLAQAHSSRGGRTSC